MAKLQELLASTDVVPRILLIEDQDLLREAFVRLLSGWGYEYTEASTCAQAREVFKPGLFACSLIDLGLPDGRGSDLLAEFSQADPRMVNMILTGDYSVDSVIGTMREGAFDYITKPVNAGILRQAVQRALLHHDAVRQQAVLTQQLIDERQQLKRKVEEQTHDLRQYASSCEASNARLSVLVRLTRSSSSGLQTEEDLVRNVLLEASSFTPLRGLVLLDELRGDFLGAYRKDEGDPTVIAVRGNGALLDKGIAGQIEWAALVQDLFGRHMDVQATDLKPLVFVRPLGGTSACTIGMLFDAQFIPNTMDQEFLGMCAHHMAAEWQMARLLRYAARYASLGTIALDLTKAFVKSLAAIQMASDVLEELATSPEMSEGLAIIPRNVTLLRDQIREFRSIAQPRTDAVETVHLENNIDQALVVLGSAIQERHVEVVRQFETDGSCVLLNGTALQRSFLELISVAVRSLSVGGKLILRLSSREKDQVRFDISLSQRMPNGSEAEPQKSLLAELRARPSFLLAQRTVNSCAGRLIMEQGLDGPDTVSVVLPRNATNARTSGDRA